MTALRALLASLILSLAVAGPAFADGAAVVRDCTDDGVLNGAYSQRDYREALSDLPTDVDEYTDCRDVIRRAQLGVGGGGAGGTGGATGGDGAGAAGGTAGGGGTPGAPGTPAPDPLSTATPEERKAFEDAVRTGGAGAIALDDGTPVRPGALGSAQVSDVSDLPTPLLVVLGLLALGGAAGAGLGARRLVAGRRLA